MSEDSSPPAPDPTPYTPAPYRTPYTPPPDIQSSQPMDSFTPPPIDASSSIPAVDIPAPDPTDIYSGAPPVDNGGAPPTIDMPEPDDNSGSAPPFDMPPPIDPPVDGPSYDIPMPPPIDAYSPSEMEVPLPPPIGMYIQPPSPLPGSMPGMDAYPEISEMGNWWDKQAAPYKAGSGYLWFHVFCCQCPGVVIALLLIMFCKTSTGKANGVRLLKYAGIGLVVGLILRVLAIIGSGVPRY